MYGGTVDDKLMAWWLFANTSGQEMATNLKQYLKMWRYLFEKRVVSIKTKEKQTFSEARDHVLACCIAKKNALYKLLNWSLISPTTVSPKTRIISSCGIKDPLKTTGAFSLIYFACFTPKTQPPSSPGPLLYLPSPPYTQKITPIDCDVNRWHKQSPRTMSGPKTWVCSTPLPHASPAATKHQGP